MENEAPVWEIILVLPSQRVSDWPGAAGQAEAGRAAGSGRLLASQICIPAYCSLASQLTIVSWF